MLATTIGLVAGIAVTCALALDWVRHPGDEGLEPGAPPRHGPHRQARRRSSTDLPPSGARGDRSVLT
jgi:hypothetical protein